VCTDNAGRNPLPVAKKQRIGAHVVSLACYLEREDERLRETVANLSRQTSVLRHEFEKTENRSLAVARVRATGNFTHRRRRARRAINAAPFQPPSTPRSGDGHVGCTAQKSTVVVDGQTNLGVLRRLASQSRRRVITIARLKCSLSTLRPAYSIVFSKTRAPRTVRSAAPELADGNRCSRARATSQSYLERTTFNLRSPPAAA
jgi:hypothetical protein